MNFLAITAYLGYLILVVNTFFYIKSFRKHSAAFKIITAYLIFSLVLQIVNESLFLLSKNNLFISHLFFIGQYILLSFFFYKVLKNNFIKKVIKLGFVIPVFFTLHIIFYIEKFFQYNGFEVIFCSVPLIVFSFVLLVEKIDSKNKLFIYFNSGFFAYLICSTLLFSVGNIKASIKSFIWYSNSVLYIFYQILIFTEWYKNFRNKNKVIK